MIKNSGSSVRQIDDSSFGKELEPERHQVLVEDPFSLLQCETSLEMRNF